jgi:hypothetical protein
MGKKLILSEDKSLTLIYRPTTVQSLNYGAFVGGSGLGSFKISTSEPGYDSP